MIEPEMGLAILHAAGATTTAWGVGGMVGQLFKGHGEGSAYVGLDAAMQYIKVAASVTNFAVGAKVGYRVPMGTSAAVRVEGGLREWFKSPSQTEITIGVGLGGLIHPK